MGNIQTVGPNEALIVSGGCCRPSRKQIIVGGWCWNTFMLTNVQRISLQIMTLNPRCENVQSKQGVPVTITGVAHCKIMSNPEFLPIAAEQFLGKTTDQIKTIVLQTIEGHMRAVIGTQELLDICKNRKQLAILVRESATQDLVRMGIDILSLTIKEIRDDVEFLSSSGKKVTAKVKRDAAITVAEAERQATKSESQHDKAREEFKVEIELSLAELNHKENCAIVTVRNEVAEAKAKAEKAYDLELSSLHKNIREKELRNELLEYDQRIKIQKLETDRRKTELEIEVELPTTSEIYEITKDNEAMQLRSQAETEAEKFKISQEGIARAGAMELEGDAEAKGMKLVAEARNQFDDAATLFEVLKILPEIAAEIASPLTKFDEIVLISDKSAAANNSSSTTNHDKYNNEIKATSVAKQTSALDSALKSLSSGRTDNINLVNSIMQITKSVPLDKITSS